MSRRRSRVGANRLALLVSIERVMSRAIASLAHQPSLTLAKY
jgi:hypothetical protein